MMKEVIDSLPLGPIETVEPEEEPRLVGGKKNESILPVPSDIIVKAASNIPQNCSSHSKTMATMTETFTTSEDYEDTSLMSSSLAFIDSFEVHNHGLLTFENHTQSEEEEEGIEHEIESVLKAKFDKVDNNGSVERPYQVARLPKNKEHSYPPRARSYPPQPVRHRPPLAPSPLYSSGSGDSWDNQYNSNRDVSLFDTIDSRDDDDEERGHEGDDERTVGIADMKRMTQKFHQSHDSSPTVNLDAAFEGPIPKFSQGPMSHLRDDSKTSLRDIFQSKFSASGTSLSTSPSNERTPWEHFKSVEMSEEKRKREQAEKSITEQKGVICTLKELIYCLPQIGGD